MSGQIPLKQVSQILCDFGADDSILLTFLRESVHAQGFGWAMIDGATTRWPASESRQGTNPWAMVRGAGRALAMGIWLARKVCAKERNASGREQ
jgi:hypothetical protein